MSENIPTIRLNLWLETADGLYFGLGRAMLLANIQKCGSLRKAADEMGMSYRAAWGKIKKCEEIIGMKLIYQSGSKSEGYRLTDAGKLFMESYFAWFDHVEKEALKKARELMPVMVRSYKEAGE
jgi:molybdate transport system regulatory protein